MGNLKSSLFPQRPTEEAGPFCKCLDNVQPNFEEFEDLDVDDLAFFLLKYYILTETGVLLFLPVDPSLPNDQRSARSTMVRMKLADSIANADLFGLTTSDLRMTILLLPTHISCRH